MRGEGKSLDSSQPLSGFLSGTSQPGILHLGFLGTSEGGAAEPIPISPKKLGGVLGGRLRTGIRSQVTLPYEARPPLTGLTPGSLEPTDVITASQGQPRYGGPPLVKLRCGCWLRGEERERGEKGYRRGSKTTHASPGQSTSSPSLSPRSCRWRCHSAMDWSIHLALSLYK